MKKYLLVIFSAVKRFILLVVLLSFNTSIQAQESYGTFDQNSHLSDDGRESADVDGILQQLRGRAQATLKQKQEQKLKKIRVLASTTGGYETNPLNSDADSSSREADGFIEERVSLKWVPTFSDTFGADLGYHFYNQNYFELTDLSTIIHALSSELNFYPRADKIFSIQPGFEYEWVEYPNDDLSVYQAANPSIQFRYSPDNDWSYIFQYVYSNKDYHSRLARDATGVSIANSYREDERHSEGISITRYFENRFIRLKGRFYQNDSNDEFQNSYDYNSYKAQIILGASCLDDKLDLSVSPGFERKDYTDQSAGSDTREDDIFQIRADVKYKISKYCSVDYGFSDRVSDSNASNGDYTNIINTLGLIVKF